MIINNPLILKAVNKKESLIDESINKFWYIDRVILSQRLNLGHYDSYKKEVGKI